jgi:hypothetical protein
MKRFFAVFALVASLGCAKHLQYQDPNNSGGSEGGESESERESSSSGGGSSSDGDGNQVGEATTPDSRGFLSMPFLTGLSEAEARATLKKSKMTGNVKIEKTECHDKSIGSGHVCNTYPTGGSTTSTSSDTVLFVVP